MHALKRRFALAAWVDLLALVSNSVSMYSIDSVSGALTLIGTVGS
jgi:hypothetical protein